MRSGDRAIRWTTTLSVVVLAGIAAVLSYKHMYILVRQYGETSYATGQQQHRLIRGSYACE